MESEVQQIQGADAAPEVVSRLSQARASRFPVFPGGGAVCEPVKASLTLVPTCVSVRCSQKAVKDAYHIICKPCALQLQLCCKCGKKEEIVLP